MCRQEGKLYLNCGYVSQWIRIKMMNQIDVLPRSSLCKQVGLTGSCTYALPWRLSSSTSP